MKTTKLFMLFLCIVCMQVTAQKNNQPRGQEDASNEISLLKLIQQKSNDYVITKEHISNVSGIRHVYVRQAINGLEIYGTESSVHIDKSDKVIANHYNFVNNIQATVKTSSQSLSANQAILSVAAQMNYQPANLAQIKSEGGINKKAVFTKAGISSEEIPVKLMYYYREGQGTVLVWELSIAELNSSDWWNFRVDANTGQIIDKDNWTHECVIEHNHSNEKTTINYNTNLFDIPNYKKPGTKSGSINEIDGIGTYNVYPMPIESPYYGSRSIVVGPENAIASPYGWHDTDGAIGAEFTNTRGNNVSAWDDEDANDAPDGAYTASPGGDLVFDFTLNTTYSAGEQSTDAATTNLFYWNNIIHDVMYQYGFDEGAGNFQENNYGNGGLGGDSVNALAQSGLGTCNANFGTPPDGGNPRMRMYVCDDEDGDLDNWVIVHEYGHGIHNRLATTGGAERMNEGWGDYYGLMLTMQSTDVGTTGRGFGSFAFQSVFPGTGGARTQPYSTDFTVNNYTYDSIKGEVAPHGVGSVWAMMLWEMTWELIEIHGFDTDFYNGTGGNNISLALVTEGLKLQPPNAGFVDGRDAILAADAAMYGGANACAIWAAFARRGLGVSAIQGSSVSKVDGAEAFDVPNPPDAVCVAPFSVTLDSNGDVAITTDDIDEGSSAICGVIDSITASPLSFTCADLGPNLVTLTVIDSYGFESTCTTTVTVEKHPTTLTYTGDVMGQYTDPITVSAQLVDADGVGIQGKSISFTIGTQSTTAVTDANGDASDTVILDQEPGFYSVDVEFVEEACFLGSTDSDPFEIKAEDAIVEYVGHTLQATPNENSSEAIVVLTANIMEVDDGYPGDIRNALVKFVNRDDNTDISPWIPVTDLFDPSDLTKGTVSYDWMVDIGNQTSESYTVGIVVGGCYTRDSSDDNTVVTVYTPVGDFITGGGYIIPNNSAGTYASTDGLKTNFGFNVKYNSGGRRLKGHMNIIFRIQQLDGIHTYQIKGNAIQSLGVNIADPLNMVAEFVTKANLKDVTDPLNPISLGGNLRLKIDITDRGEPGIDDSIGINLTNSSGILLYSSNWEGLFTSEMVLSGGNLVVHSGFSQESQPVLGDNGLSTELSGIILYPNPVSESVNLRNSDNLDLKQVTIYDLTGRIIKVVNLEDAGILTSISMSSMASSTYLFVIEGATQSKVIRVVKK